MRFHHEERVADVIRENAPKSGVYILPNFYQMKKEQGKENGPNCRPEDIGYRDCARGKEMMQKGPVVFAAVQLNGMGSLKVALIISLIIDIIAAYFVTWLFVHTKLDYRKGVIFIAVAGLFAGIMAYLPAWNWWGLSVGYTFAGIASMVVAWFLAGLAIVKLAAKHR